MTKKYSVKQVSIFTVSRLLEVERILYASGKHMAAREGLHHWDNSHFKTLIIVILCMLKNKVFIVYEDKNAVATFQTQITGDILVPEKLAIFPACLGRGLGSFCWERIEREAKAAGCRLVRSYVYEKNKNAVLFHTHKGYSIVGKKKTLKYTELKMERILE